MSYQYKLQIPIPEELNKQLRDKVKELGFSSVSEATRFLLVNFVNGNLSVGFFGKQSSNGENWGDIEEILREALQEQKEGRTQRLDSSRPIHQQIMEGK